MKEKRPRNWSSGAFFNTGQREVKRLRLDKYLKVSRLIKRRSVANDACDAGRVMVNGKQAKAGTSVKEGDIIEVQFGNSTLKAEVLQIVDTTRKEEAKEMYRVLS